MRGGLSVKRTETGESKRVGGEQNMEVEERNGPKIS